MIKAPRNMQAGSDHVRVVGPHPHEWKNVGTDARGEVYQECIVCGTRRWLRGARFEALRFDWLEGTAPWDLPEDEPKAKVELAPEPDDDDDSAAEPAKRKPGRPRKSA